VLDIAMAEVANAIWKNLHSPSTSAIVYNPARCRTRNFAAASAPYA
jgi:hypothetical protein